MSDSKIIEWKVNLKDSKLTNEQTVNVYGLIEHHIALSLLDEMGTCPQVNVHLKFA